MEAPDFKNSKLHLMHDEFLVAVVTLAVFGVVSVVLYLIFFKPLRRLERTQSPTPNRSLANTAQHTRGQGDSSSFHQRSSESLVWPFSVRKPPHATKVDALLNDGIVSFRSTAAAALDLSDKTMAASIRKERVKILSRILALDSDLSPPPRGSVVVVTIPAEDVDCSKLRRILFSLASYLNLILIISVNESSTVNEIDHLCACLRGSGEALLSEAVLPSHRILAAQSTIGRTAIIRQLGKVEFVLDYDDELMNQLVRFGFKVLLYENSKRQPGVSRLASTLRLLPIQSIAHDAQDTGKEIIRTTNNFQE